MNMNNLLLVTRRHIAQDDLGNFSRVQQADANFQGPTDASGKRLIEMFSRPFSDSGHKSMKFTQRDEARRSEMPQREVWLKEDGNPSWIDCSTTLDLRISFPKQQKRYAPYRQEKTPTMPL
jgi:hypothetical protein